METLQVNAAFVAVGTQVLLVGNNASRIAVRGIQLTLNPGAGNGALVLRSGVDGAIFRMGNPPDPSFLTLPIAPIEDPYFVLGAGRNLELVWSFAGAGNVVGIICYDLAATVTAANTANA